MCAGDYGESDRRKERRKVRQGLPPCLTELGVTVLEFREEITYAQQQEALVALSNWSLARAKEMHDC